MRILPLKKSVSVVNTIWRGNFITFPEHVGGLSCGTLGVVSVLGTTSFRVKVEPELYLAPNSRGCPVNRRK
jgi:hypothetical protein